MLPELHAERQLEAIEAASVPHMTEPGRREVLGRYSRRLRGPGTTTRARSAHEALTQAGVRVVEVPARKGAKATTGRVGTRRKGERG